MIQWFIQPFNLKSYTHPIAQLDGVFEQEVEPRVADAAEPAFLAASLPSRNDADAGAEQWYKTIAKLMQGRNIKSTLTSEPRV